MILTICFFIIITTIILILFCKKLCNFTQILNYELCENNGWKGFFKSKKHCIRQMEKLNNNLNYQAQGQPANRGIHNTGLADSGAFGDNQIIT